MTRFTRAQRMGLAAVIVAALIAACREASAPESGGVGSGGHEVLLRRGETVTVPGTLVVVGFADVLGDSRCPVDVVCVWAGNGAVLLEVSYGRGPAIRATLNTGLEPRATTIGPYRVALVALEPQPLSGRPIPMECYRVRLGVEALSRLLRRVAAGEEVIIAKAGKPVARLMAVAPWPHSRVLGVERGRIWVAEDFDAPLPPDVLAAFEDEAPRGRAVLALDADGARAFQRGDARDHRGARERTVPLRRERLGDRDQARAEQAAPAG